MQFFIFGSPGAAFTQNPLLADLQAVQQTEFAKSQEYYAKGYLCTKL